MTQHFWFNLFVFMNTSLLILLALNISRLRMTEKIPNGDGGSVTMKKAIRAHGNGVEHAVVAGLIVLALEFGQTPSALLITVIIGFTASRVLHAAGMLGSNFNARRFGAGATYFFEVLGAGGLLMYGVLA
ncbi:MAG: MAPEG family protein [Marinobacter sp.]|uniref:MAPEG family protein n=1 Tax=Marinobacter sp. TaxID=50741 RepID=UPI00396E3282